MIKYNFNRKKIPGCLGEEKIALKEYFLRNYKLVNIYIYCTVHTILLFYKIKNTIVTVLWNDHKKPWQKTCLSFLRNG